MLHGQGHGQEPRSYVPRLSPLWVFMRHSPFLIPNTLGISTFRAKEQRSMSYDKGPVTLRMNGIFAFSTNNRRAWNILPFLKSPTQGDGRVFYSCTSTTGIYILRSYLLLSKVQHSTVLTSLIFRCQRYSTNSKLYSPTAPPPTQSQIPHSKFPIPNRPESTATPMFGTLCGEVIT